MKQANPASAGRLVAEVIVVMVGGQAEGDAADLAEAAVAF
jgi:hypothetical protein